MSTDNFLKTRFQVDGKEYISSEHYFQCQKATNEADFKLVHASGPGVQCWQAGNPLKIKPDWEKIKVRVMYRGNLEKFRQNEDLKKELLESHGKLTMSASTAFWNYWNANIMMSIRALLRDEGEEDKKTVADIEKLMQEYENTH